MRITYFNRSLKTGYSIQRVFGTIISEIGKYAEVNIYNVPSKHALPWDIIRNNIYAYRHKNMIGINHITGHIHEVVIGLLGAKNILTIHDLVFLDNVKNPLKRFYKWLFWLYLPLKIADKVVCISTKTKHNILSRIATNKLVVIPNPIDPAFTYSPKPFNSTKPVILHIGTGWNKNLPRVIQALATIDCHLRIIGKITAEISDLLQQYDLDYSQAQNLTDQEIIQEYKNCDIVSFPSEYEGFGMPVIEGQQTGRVVLTSHIEPLIEVSGNAVVFVDPKSVPSIQNGFQEIINNCELRTSLIEKGLKNVERFAPAKIAASYLELYKEINI